MFLRISRGRIPERTQHAHRVVEGSEPPVDAFRVIVRHPRSGHARPWLRICSGHWPPAAERTEALAMYSRLGAPALIAPGRAHPPLKSGLTARFGRLRLPPRAGAATPPMGCAPGAVVWAATSKRRTNWTDRSGVRSMETGRVAVLRTREGRSPATPGRESNSSAGPRWAGSNSPFAGYRVGWPGQTFRRVRAKNSRKDAMFLSIS